MPTARKTLKVIGIIILIPLTCILMILIVLFIQYRLTIRDYRDYSGGQAVVYTETGSLKKISLKLLNNTEVNSLLRLPSLKGAYQIVADLKQNPFLKNPFLLSLIDVPAGFALYDDMSYLICADLKVISMFSRYASNFLFLAPKNTITTHKSDTGIILEIKADGASYFMHFKDNIVVFSNNLERVKTAADNYGSRQSSAFKSSIDESAKLLDHTAFLDIFINPERTVKSMLTPDLERDKWIALLNLKDNGVCSIDLGDKTLGVRAVTEMAVENKPLGDVLAWKPNGWKVFPQIPENVTAFTGLNFKSFRSLYEVFLSVKGQDMQKILADLNSASNLLFGMDMDELVFSWMGHEAGVFFMEGNLDPVIFIELGDEAKYRKIIKKITTSLVVSSDNDVRIGDLTLSRISFPPFIRFIVDMFVKGLETPYYTDNSKYAFFSMNPENLAKTVSAVKEGKTLSKTEGFKTIKADSYKNAQMIMFFDTSAWIPPFAARDSLLSGLFNVFGRGLIAFEGSDAQCALQLELQGLVKAGIRPFAGFPRNLEGGAKEVLLADIRNSAFPEIIWLDNTGKLRCSDIFSQTSTFLNTGKEVDVFSGKYGSKDKIWVYKPSGELVNIHESWSIADGYPITNLPEKAAHPLYYNDALYINDTKAKTLVKVALPGGQMEAFFSGLPSRLYDAPVSGRSSILFGTRDFEGSVFLCDLNGKLFPGFPVYSGGISARGPFFLYFDGREYVCQLTQAGALNLWDNQGVEKAGFPVEVKGVFDSRPVVFAGGGTQALALVDREGNISLISTSGSIGKTLKSEQFKGEETELIVLDLYSDGDPELIVYGGKTKLEAYDSTLNLLEGFPIMGGQKPWLADLDSDGTMELISAGYDDRLYVYSLNKESNP